jgi:hypothetical protein
MSTAHCCGRSSRGTSGHPFCCYRLSQVSFVRAPATSPALASRVLWECPAMPSHVAPYRQAEACWKHTPCCLPSGTAGGVQCSRAPLTAGSSQALSGTVSLTRLQEMLLCGAYSTCSEVRSTKPRGVRCTVWCLLQRPVLDC